MKIVDLLKLKLLEHAKVLAGEHKLDNIIESVMIIEAIDIERWAVKNQVLITSYAAFQHQNEAALLLFFDKIAAIGISGIIFKIERLVDEVPQYFIDLCETKEIPLIQIPGTLGYESIILSIHEPILNYESFLLRQYYDANKQFSPFIDSRFSYEDLAQQFVNFTNQHISLSLEDKLFTSSQFEKPLSSRYSEQIVDNGFAKHTYRIRSYNTAPDTTANHHYVYIHNHSDFRQYTLTIQLDSDTIDSSLVLAIEKFLDILVQKIDADYYKKNELFLHRNKTISTILFGMHDDTYDLKLLLEDINLFHHPYYQILLINLPRHIDVLKLDTLKKAFSKSDILFVYYESKNTLIFLFNVHKPNQKISKTLLQKLLPKIDNVHYYLSTVGTYQEIRTLLTNTLRLKEFNDSFFTSYIIDEDDLGVFNFLIRLPKDDYNAAIPNNLKQLFDNHYELFCTLHTFIKNNLNFAATANEMYLHHKTVRYRMGKIEQLLNLDLNNPIQLTNYIIGCVLLHLVNDRKEKANPKAEPHKLALYE
ncbi:PucR family transcriptional regulator [Carnobacteriaceae bacterium zg-C25]|nr:PucR family transcriptional regulator [Carnobacteriaceae bacterium zg-C25]